jgi:hypothetical protein
MREDDEVTGQGTQGETVSVVPDASRPPLRDPGGRFLRGTGRPPKRRPGGQRENLNALRSPASRAAVLWKKRILSKQDSWLRPLIADYQGALLNDKPDASEAERRVIEAAAIARAAVMLLMSAAAKQGGLASPVVTVSGPSLNNSTMMIRRHSPDLLAGIGRFLKVELGALTALGLERRQRPVPSLSEYVEAQARAVREES